MCTVNLPRGWQSWVSVLAEPGTRSSACPCTAQLHRTLVHSPGAAPREAGTQPGLSYTGISDAGSCWAETCTQVERSNLDVQDPAGPSLSLPFWKKIKITRSLCGKSSITCRDLQDGHWKKDLGDTAATKDEKRGRVHAHQFLTGTGLK